MSVISDAAVSRGDVMKRLDELETKIEQLQTSRRSVSTAIGSGGLRVRGGAIVIQDASGVETMRLSTDGLSLTGVLQLIGELQVIGGGDIQVTDGRLVAADASGDVFAVDPRVPEIFMRKELISDLVNEIVEELIGSPAGSTLIRGLIGEAIHTDSIETQETTGSTNFTDLATVGPQVTAPISSTGRALVEFGCVFTTDTVNDHVSMSFEVSGATSQPPSGSRSVQLQFASAVIQSTSMAVMVEGLNEGNHTFTAKYKVTTIGATGFFGNRWMIVTPY